MTLCPFAIWRPVPSHSGPMASHNGLVLHVQVGDNSCYGEFSNPANQASSTWWVAKSGVLEQYVDADMAAWTEAAGNFTWDSVETEGTPDQPLTSAQIATLAKLYAWGHSQYGWPYALTDDVNGRGFIWHGAGGVAWGNHPDCPGDLRKAQRQQILDLAQGSVPVPPTPTPTPPPIPQETRMFYTDPVTGLLVATDRNGNIYARADALPHVVTLGQHPEWKAGWAESWSVNPCVGIVSERDSTAKGGTWGYTFICQPTSGAGGLGIYNTYHINRDGSF